MLSEGFPSTGRNGDADVDPEGRTPPWPALCYETLPWAGQYDHGVASRSQVPRREGPYQAAVAPTIATRSPALPAEVVALVEDAATEIARFDHDLGGEIAPFATILLRSESVASSQIENLTASARAIAEAEIGTSGRHNAAQIVANVRAMEAAVALADRLDAEAILAMHRALMDTREPDLAGCWRGQQVWAGGSNLGPHTADFVPPHHSRILPAIDDLVAFMRRDDLSVLVQAAIGHAQFATIQPFRDGNGRTGRALLHAILRGKGLTRSITVPISAGLLADTTTYFDALGRYRAGDPAAIVRRLTQAAFAAMANGRRLVADLRAIRQGWNSRIIARQQATTWRLADLLLRRPVINAQVVVQELGITPTNVYRAIEPLVKARILVEFTDQKRNRAWRSAEVLAALDGFAVRAGRRTPPT